jgi:hypothetical protein
MQNNSENLYPIIGTIIQFNITTYSDDSDYNSDDTLEYTEMQPLWVFQDTINSVLRQSFQEQSLISEQNEIVIPKEFYKKHISTERETRNQSMNCLICLSSIVDQEDVCTIHKTNDPCHLFHEKCLKQWLKIKATCPTCRIKVDSCFFKKS